MNADSVDAAILLACAWDIAPGGRLAHRLDSVLVLNMSDNATLGGRQRVGAGELGEELCYRTSLSLTFDNDHIIQHNPPGPEGVYAAK